MDLPRLRKRHLAVFALIALLALAGCQTGSNADEQTVRPDPETDRIGWEDGYWHDDPVPVDESDGYNESEREAVVARTMARVEELRGLEFRDNVSVETVSRAEHRNSTGANHSISSTHVAYHDQIWEAALILGEDTSSLEMEENISSSAVAGYYDPESDEIVIVGTESLDVGTLAHELTHAVQDQHFNITADPAERDRDRARTMVIEGDAELVQSKYTSACGERWSCVGESDGGISLGDLIDLASAVGCAFDSDCEPDRGVDIDRGYLMTFAQPYATGGEFVDGVYERGNWSAVNDLYANYPTSTEQVMHPEAYPDERPVDVAVPDRSSDEWQRFDHDPEVQTLGESMIAITFIEHGVGNRTDRYTNTAATGWAGDSLVPYRNGSGGHGYVWETRWDTERDAREFADAYRSILADRANASADQRVYVVPETDPFADAFRVTRDGKQVTIVNAPTREALPNVYARDG